MGSPVSVPRSAGVRRFLRTLFISLSTLTVITCAEDPVGPAISEGRLRVVPVFEANARLAPLAIDRVRVVVARIAGPEEQGPVVVDDTIPFDLNDAQLTIRDIRVTMEEQTENVEVTLQMLAGAVLLFEGQETVALVRGRSTSSTNIPMTYQGPGANVATLSITPRDTTLAPRATFSFGLDAFDNQGAPVLQHYASWSLVGGPAAGARINAAGQLTAPAVPDTFYVKAVNLPTGVADSTRVIIGTVTPPPPGQVLPAPLSAGDQHTCEIRGNTTYCWGDNNSGQLGDGTGANRVVPTPVLGSQVFVAVSAGYSHTCALTAQGSAFCWGDNSTGALGDGTTTDHNTPVAVSGGLTYAQISAGLQFTCAVTLTGEGRCWGSNFSGQLGDGSFNQRQTPTLVAGGHNFTRITSAAEFDISSDHSCAIDANGAGWCWGDNSQGQLGTGNQNGSQVPVAVTGGQTFSEISAGGRSTCALATSGGGFCWGLNFGVALTSPTPVAGGLTYSALDMGDTHVCAKATAGWVCGGNGTEGQLGDGSGQDQVTPIAPAGGRTYTLVAAGGRHTCGITATGTFCWGSNSNGQLGIGDDEGTGTSTPVAVMGAPSSISIVAGNNQTTLVNVDVGVPPQVRVLDVAGQPVGGAEVVFTVTAGGGVINGGAATISQLTSTNGTVGVTWTMGPTPGGNTLSARVSANGVTGNPVSFTATATGTVAAFTWTGAVSNDWAVAGNWSPAQVPAITDSVVIPAGPTTQPLLSANQVVGAISISGGRLTINGQGLVVARGLSTSGTGVLVMQSANDIVTVGGNAVFDGGNELNLMSAGGLSLAGNLTQRATNSGDSFHPSGTHITLFTGTAPTISFATPGVVPGTSHFQELAWVGGGTMTLLTQAMAHGNMTITSAAAGTITSANGSRLTVGNLITIAGLTLNDVPLTISQAVTGPLALDNISFQAMPTNVAQLVINHPGSGSAFTFTNLQFGTVPVAPNGFYLDVTDNNGATDGVLTINMTGAAPASGAPFVQAAGGAVVNWPFIPLLTWTGAVNTVWSNAANWNPAVVPGPADNVAIVAATLQPTLTGPVSVNNVTISGAGARLTIGGQTLNVGGNLVVHTDGLLVMTSPADLVSVTGDAAFQGGNETGLLSAGELRLFGNFNQQQQTTPLSFVASGTHRTVMRNTTALQTVTFCCTTNTSGFQNLDLSSGMGINIQFSLNGVFVFDTLISRPGAGPTPLLYMLGSPLTARRFSIDRLTVDRGTLTLNEQGVVANQLFDNVTFQNYLPTQTQLAITAMGGSPNRALTFNNLAFQPLVAGNTGKYLTVAASAQTLVLNLPGGSPAANGPAFTTVSGATTVNWPAAAVTWTGAVSTDWHTAGNWSSAAVPSITSNVVIPSGTPNAPTVSTAAASINSLVVAPGATLTLTTFSLTVAGNVDVGGAVAGNATLVMSGTATLRGAVQNLTINGAVTLNGNTTTAAIGTASISGAGADLRLGGFTFVANNFLTQNGATLTMTNPADSLVATGTAQFTGGSTLGKLTAGVIDLQASFSQASGGSTTSFASTGTRVRATGTSTNTFTFASGGATLSRFSSLIVSKSGGTLNLSGTVVAATDSISVTTATPLSISGTLLPSRTLRLAAGAGLGGAGTVRMTADSLFVATPANYTIQFTDFNGTGPQLIPPLPYVNLSLSGNNTHSVTGTTTVTSALNVSGAGAVLVLANQRLNVNILNVSGTGVVRMTQPLDSLFVSGNTSFQGGDETGQLTAGLLRVGGSFSTTTATSFVATGSHKTLFAGNTSQTVTIPNGGPAATRFQDVEIRNTSTGVNLATTAQVMQINGTLSLPQVTTFAGAGSVVAANVSTLAGSTLSVANLTAPASTFGVAGTYLVGQTTLTGGGSVPNNSFVNLILAGPGVYGASGSRTISGNLELQTSYNVGNGTVSVGKTLRTTGAGFLSMTDAGAQVDADSAVFTGGDETGHLSAGNLTVRVALVQRNTVSPSSFVATLGHTVTLTGPSVNVDFQNPDQSPLMNLVSNAGNTVIGFLRVNGNLNANGNNFNASTLNVRGTMTTALATGCGIDSLILGSSLPAGNGYIAANHYVFDQTTGTQTIPGQNANLPYNDNNADITVRSNAVLGGTITGTNRLVIDGAGTLALNGQRATVIGNFSTAGNGLLSMTNPLDSLIVGGSAAFNGGAEFGSLTDGHLILGGNFSHAASQFRAQGNHQTIFTNAAALITSGGVEPIFNDLVVSGSLTLGTNTNMVRDLIMLPSSHLVSLSNQELRGTRNISTAGGSTVTPFVLELTGTIASAGLLSPTNIIFSGSGLVPASSATIVYKRITIGNFSSGYTAGGTITAPNGMAIQGPFTLGANTVTINDLLVFQPTARLIMNNSAGVLNIATIASFDGGDETGLLTAGTIRISGSMGQSASNSPNSFRATGTHTVIFDGSGAQIGIATAGSQFQNLLINVPNTLTITDGPVVAAGNLTVSSGRLILNGRRVDVGQNLAVNGANSTIAMQSGADSLIVGNAATFAGGTTSGLLSAGVLRVSGDFTQSAAGGSTTSFAPSGTHKTVLGSAAGGDISMGSPGLGAAGSHFQVLDVTPATGGLTLDVNMQADSLISTSNLARLVGGGQTLTVRRAQVTGLTSSWVPLILDEQGVASTENLSGINFTGFASGGGTMLTVIGPGNSFAPRPAVTTNNVLFNPARGNGGVDGFYVDLTTTNNQAFNLNMSTSNRATLAGGNGAQNFSVTPGTGIATVTW